MFALYHFVGASNVYLVPPTVSLGPEPAAGRYLSILSNLLRSIEVTGIILQLLLNHRMRHFAGRHKSVMIVEVIGTLCFILHLTPSAVGRSDMGMGLSLGQALMTAITVPMVWQALTLSSVPQTYVDEDEE